MKPKHILSFLASLLIIIACQDKKKEEAINSVKEWMGKEILFPRNKALRTFLLDKENKIVAIGNPIENPNIKKFYLKILTGKEQKSSAVQTTVKLSTQELNLGSFPKEETKTGEILFKNTGDKPFVIYDVVTSCGCTKVDYPKTPIPPGGTLKFTITYEADSPGYFRKNLKVYGNMAGSPMKLIVKGETH